MTPDLFFTATQDSPRTAWLKRHNLIVREYQHPHSLNGSHRWVCANRPMTRYVAADTEDEAEQAFAAREGLTWWKLADWNGAMAEPFRVPCHEEGVFIVRAYGTVDETASIVSKPPDSGWDL